MKKQLTAAAAACLLFASVGQQVLAEPSSAKQQELVLCCEGDVYSADFILSVSGEGSVSSVRVNDPNCFYDWNYVESDARLYISLASGGVLSKTEFLASVTADSGVKLEVLSIVVNGRITDGVYSSHTPDGSSCAVCGVPLRGQGESPELLGDLDGDGYVNIYDSILLFQHSMIPTEYPLSYQGNIDFTKDGYVDIADALLLFQYSMYPDYYPID